VGCCAVLAHGGNEDAVAQGSAAYGERLKELRYRLGGFRGCRRAWGDDVLWCEVFEVGHADVEFWWWCHVDCKYSSFSYNPFVQSL
jgi:hypothetical protein